ncbi:MAG: flagellar basal body L-ring protein FlgH [Alphaproteobacteria bacterium]
MRNIPTLALTVVALAACQTMTRPTMTPVGANLNNPQTASIATPMIIPTPPKPAAGSLWVPGNKQFFKDSRARTVGDLVTVMVDESAEAKGEAKSESNRTHNSSSGVSVLPFISGQLLTRGIDLATNGLNDTDSNRDFKGKGKNERKDRLTGSIAAVVTQVLPNDLLVIQGQREVMVNYEKQIMKLTGVVRAEDITSGNTIPSSKIAEARIAYVGDGVVDSAQTPQWGVTVLDKVLPF